ncbi:hypothetical protein ACOSP7_015498 [Xanthoceras sorbifolium]
MRFKKGDKVEVLSQKEVPSGSWHCAEIICGNGHNYTVKYDGYSGASEKTVLERVSRKAIRPCPPPMAFLERWIPGDVVEVFDNFSWKMATIAKVSGKSYFLVRLLGSSLEFKVRKCKIRLRQSWEDDKWMMIGEGSGCCEDGTQDKNLILKNYQKSSIQVKKTNKTTNLHVTADCFLDKNKGKFQESHIASSRTLKRGFPYCYSQGKGYTGAAEKFRAIEKAGRLHRLIAVNPSPLPDQVDAVALPTELLGETYIHPSSNNGTALFSEVEAERRKPTGAFGCSVAVNLESNDARSLACSVGSCSISSNDSYRLPRHVSAGRIDDSDGNFSDAESFCHLGYEEGNCLLPTKEELADEIHRLELHAYRCTMEALHASGPLSWEQEAMG